MATYPDERWLRIFEQLATKSLKDKIAAVEQLKVRARALRRGGRPVLSGRMRTLDSATRARPLSSPPADICGGQ
jgi:hypothetical protein